MKAPRIPNRTGAQRARPPAMKAARPIPPSESTKPPAAVDQAAGGRDRSLGTQQIRLRAIEFALGLPHDPKVKKPRTITDVLEEAEIIARWIISGEFPWEDGHGGEV